MKKWLAVGIILLFVGAGVIPLTAQELNTYRSIGDTPNFISDDYKQNQNPSMLSQEMTELDIMIQGPRTMTIKNIGNAAAYNVSWFIRVTGAFFILGRYSKGQLPSALEPSQEITIGQNEFLFGFGGPIEITYAAWADNAPMYSETLSPGFLWFFFFRSR